MKIKQFGHISFNCKNLEKSVHFYCNILGLKEKFSLNYSEMIQNMKNMGVKLPKSLMSILEKRKNKTWITYLEIADGVFIELFDQIGAFLTHKAQPFHNNFQHFALIVEDIQKTKEDLVRHGIKIDIDISLGSDNTYQMWIKDPDGNKIEIMQYTEKSLQTS